MRIFYICKDLFISCTEHYEIQKAYAKFNSNIVISIKYGEFSIVYALLTRGLVREM